MLSCRRILKYFQERLAPMTGLLLLPSAYKSRQSGRVNALKLAVQSTALLGVQHCHIINPSLNGSNGLLVGCHSLTDLRSDCLNFGSDAIVFFHRYVNAIIHFDTSYDLLFVPVFCLPLMWFGAGRESFLLYDPVNKLTQLFQISWP